MNVENGSVRNDVPKEEKKVMVKNAGLWEKFDGPARAVSNIGIDRFEEFPNEKKLAIINAYIQENLWHLSNCDFFGHSTFRAIVVVNNKPELTYTSRLLTTTNVHW